MGSDQLGLFLGKAGLKMQHMEVTLLNPLNAKLNFFSGNHQKCDPKQSSTAVVAVSLNPMFLNRET